MRPLLRYGALLFVGILVCSCALTGTASGQPRVLLDAEFDGPAGSPPDGIWQVATGGGGWGNNESQIYTDHPDNISLDGNGHLALTARRDVGGQITSARISTANTFAFTYGRAEARIALPAGTGLHPAFWLLGANLDEVGWPAAGEIDVIETLNHATEWHSAVHAPQAGTERGQQMSAAGPVPFPLAGVFRTYWVERTPGRIVTGVDDLTLLTVTPFNLADGATWVFDAPFELLLNLAVGGNWPGPADGSTPFPTTMLVDWVRVTEL
ncbi:glycoside hydrolase family 16 protein [Mycobacterium frederiksbergense]|uniref:glycoside hydrolase family 16 protein n=1 Tax=Mycolicibacterium frederiksbergense TaxID=117567 RepID=UPI0021F3735E|nr:glycoside hydrolase family 16 protein [Mycolicibacterium frederiksbergense]MCV7048033.1 glycoside hydrolase family 16 protein [Mycolicibacterium frederiksbergense]